MSAGIYNIVIEQGATYRRRLVWKINSNPVNLTGYSARLKVRTVPRGMLVLSLTTDVDGGITLGTTDGVIDLALSATQTALLNAGKYGYDLELVSAGGDVTRLVKGTFTISPEVTY